MSRFARLRADLQAVRSESDDVVFFTVKDAVTGNYFRLREPEYWLISQLDGKTPPEEVASRFRETFNLNISAEAVEQFIAALEKLFFLEDGRSEQELARAAKKAGRRTSLAGRLLYVKLKAFAPGRSLERITSLYRRFHNPAGIVLQLLLIVIGMVLLGVHRSNFAVNLGELFNIASIVTIVAAIFLMVTMHEFAHAVACRMRGGQVREMGFLLMYFQPCFYCDLSDAWLFKKKSHRLAVTWAGPYFQFIFLALAVIIWRITVPGTWVSEFSRICAIVAWVNFLFNFNPLIKLDGYYLLSDWLDIPNLRQKAFAYVGNVLKRWLLGWPVEPILVAPREKRIFVAYASLAFIYSTFLVLYVLWILAQFLVSRFGGFGLLLLLAALGLIMKQNVAEAAQGTIHHVKHMKRLLQQPVRLTIYAMLAVALCIVLFFIQFPHRVTGDVVVQPLAEYSIHTYDTGLMETTFQRGGANPQKNTEILKLVTQEVGAIPLRPTVREGQQVRAGDTLALVTSNTVSKDLASAISDLDRLTEQLALLKSPPKREQVDEAQARVVSARAAYDKALRDLKRIEGLASRELIAEDQLESARSIAEIAKAELDNRTSYLALVKAPPKPEEEAVLQRDMEKAKSRIDFLNLQAGSQTFTSPIAGTVTLTRRSDALLSVISSDTVEILVPVSDFDINLVRIGQPVRVKVRSYPGDLFWGEVVRVPDNANDIGQGMRFPVAVAVDNSGCLLRQGMTGYAKIEVGKKSLAGRGARKALSVLRVEFWSWWLW